MKLVVRGAVAVLAFGIVGSAGAQGTPAAASTCDVGGGSGATAKASLFLQRAAAKVQAKQDASKDLKDAISALTQPGKGDDSVTRAYYLGQAYVLLLQQPGVAPVGARSSFGIATNPSANIDLLAAADSAFTMVETTHPGCRAELANWREQKPWLDMMNASIAALNEEKYDSAAVLAQRALIIDRRAPYAYSVLAAVANEKKDFARAASMLQKAIDAASADTMYAETRVNATYDLANTLSRQADDAPAAAKRPLAQQAVKVWQNFITAGTKDAQIAHAVATSARLLQDVGDTAAMAQVYAPILANPSHFGEQTLLNAGVIATRAQRPGDAVKLFAAVLDRNPYQRDALKNLAASYVATKESEKIPPIVSRLVALDPNNSDNWLLYAYAYSGLLKGTKDKKLTKTYTDSLVWYNNRAEKLTPRVEITQFTYGRPDNSVTLGGNIENRAATQKSATVSVEFLDASGKVVGTGSTTVGPIPPKGTAKFTVTAQAPGAAAYRYKPIT